MSQTAQSIDYQARLKEALAALQKLRTRLETVEQAHTEPIAIIGLGCRYPGGARTPESFWALLRDGVDAVSEIPANRWDVDALFDPDPDAPGKMYTRWGGFLEQVDQFDPHFFGIAPREAQQMDPQQRLLLEVTWEALENAGYAPDGLNGSRTGVFVGITCNDYLQLQAGSGDYAGINPYRLSGNHFNAAPGRVSYILGLQGPCMALDTACSSSLVAVHQACQSLRLGESDLALAGGVNLILSPEWMITLCKNKMMAPDGRCKTFDARADGFVRSEGCGLVVLKRLSAALADGDPILAVIRGSAINQDGFSSGFTVPNKLAQEAVIREALKNAGVAPREVGYIEAHGTGTSLGDPIEVRALQAALSEGRSPTDPFWLGSIKTNFGHAESAAGVAGLIKVVLSLQHEAIPPHLHFSEPSQHIPWSDIPVRIPTELTPWPAGEQARIAGVSSFGASGVNAHLVIAEAPRREVAPATVERPWHLLTLAAKNEPALTELARRYDDYLAAHPAADLADVCLTTHLGRTHFAHRLALVANTTEQMRHKLAGFLTAPGSESAPLGHDEQPGIVFLFTGQGAQYHGMGHQLYQTQPVFRATLDQCDEILRPLLDVPLLDVLYGSQELEDREQGAGSRDDEKTRNSQLATRNSLLDLTVYTQPALFALEYALAQVWRSWGIEPAAVLGHSIGEYVAACLAGVFSLEDGLKLIAARGRLMQSLPGNGAMAAIFATEAQVGAAIEPYAGRVAVAGVNGPANRVISGDSTAVDAILAQLQADGLKARRLTVSHAFHSPLVEPILAEFEQLAGQVRFNAPRLPLVSNVTGQLIRPDELGPAYWRRHLRDAVQFAAGIDTLRRQGYRLFLEIGPSPTLLGMARRCWPDQAEAAWLPSLRQGRDDWQQILESLGALYRHGTTINWPNFEQPTGDGRRPGRRIALPTYPFQRQRYWFDPAPRQPISAGMGLVLHPLLGRRVRSAGQEIVFETQLGPALQPFLADHRVYGAAVMPATAFLEMALAAARHGLEQGPYTVEDVVIHRALVFADDAAQTVQVILTPEDAASAALQIFSLEPESESWRLHVSGKLRAALEPAATASILPAELQRRCPEPVSTTGHYDQLRARGLEFGPGFQGLEQIWRNGQAGELLGQVRLPEMLADETGQYQCHPALLDACLQLFGSAFDNGNTDSYLPLSLDRFTLSARSGPQVWSHVVLRAGADLPPDTLIGDVQLFDESGQTIGELHGLALKRAGREAISPAQLDNWLYRVVWQPAPLNRSAGAIELRSPAQVAERLQPHLQRLSVAPDIVQFEALRPRLNALSRAYILAALQQLGWQPQPGQRITAEELAQTLNIVQPQQRLLQRLLGILQEDGLLQPSGQAWEVRRSPQPPNPEAQLAALQAEYPACHRELSITGRIGRHFAAALRGQLDPLELLFPNGSLTETEQLYQDSPFAYGFNTLVGEAVVAALERAGDGGPVRILEIGAGTGGTTNHILPHLPSEQIEYVFTDVSPLFINRARQKFQAYPFVRYQTLDIERSPETQGLVAHQFDLIVAANVLHATRDLRQTLGHVRQLLAPTGLLLLLEGTAPQPFVDIIVGLTEGWWRFADHDLRPAYPLLPTNRWRTLLAEMEFTDVQAVAGQSALSHQALLLAQEPTPAAESRLQPGGGWLIFADESGLGPPLAARLTAEGQRVALVSPGDNFAQPEPGRFRINPARPGDFRRLVSEALPGVESAGVIYLWPLADALTGPASLTTAALTKAQELLCGGALYLVQALAAAEKFNCSGLWLITRGAQPVGQLYPPPAVAQASLWGLGAVIAQEHPELNCIRLDLEPAGVADNSEIDPLWQALLAQNGEDQVALRQGQRFVPRLVGGRTQLAAAKSTQILGGRPFRLDSAAPGVLDSLEFRPLPRRAPGPGEVEIEVHATGLGFRDVLTALGMRPGDSAGLGYECAGKIAAVGPGVTGFKPSQAVVAVAPGSFGSFVTVRAELAAPKPARLSLVEAATLPSAFLTAHYTLRRLAQLKTGQRVLIHAAAGGVGLAAVQIAQQAGAEIFGTAGSPAKRAWLKALGVHHVLDSRSLDFVDEILTLTGSAGVDVVLNSLSDEFIPASLSALAETGHFLEIGKRGIWSHEQVAAVKPQAAYTVVDLTQLAEQQPAFLSELLREVVAAFDAGPLHPLPLRVFPMQETVEAFRWMAQARHIGKIVVTHPVAGQPELPPIRPDAAYLITGGLGGLGLVFARRLVEQGARHLTLVGRHAPSAQAQTTLAELRQRGANITVAQADVADSVQLDRVLAEIKPPLRGVIHAAGVLDDGVLLQQDWSRFAAVFRPKVEGGWNLHQLTRHLPLDFFALFSSAVSLIGSAGQANHVAASTFLDALAHYRRAQGLPAVSLDWGPWSQVGAAVERNVEQRLLDRGLNPVNPAQGVQLFERAMRQATPHSTGSDPIRVGVLPVDWSRFVQQFSPHPPPPFFSAVARRQPTHAAPPASKPKAVAGPNNWIQRLNEAPPKMRSGLLQTYVQTQSLKVLGLESDYPLNPRQPLQELGLDSLMAVELRNLLGAGLNLPRSLPATLVFGYPTVEALAGYLADQFFAPAETAAQPTDHANGAAGRPASIDLASLEQLSDEEAEALLLAQLQKNQEKD